MGRARQAETNMWAHCKSWLMIYSGNAKCQPRLYVRGSIVDGIIFFIKLKSCWISFHDNTHQLAGWLAAYCLCFYFWAMHTYSRSQPASERVSQSACEPSIIFPHFLTKYKWLCASMKKKIRQACRSAPHTAISTFSDEKACRCCWY